MKITYIGHSGFLVELDRTLLLFDYYTGRLPALAADKDLYVFVTHTHRDHFNTDIFKLGDTRENIFYVLSFDIKEKLIPENRRSSCVRLEAGENWEHKGIAVTTLPSTDSGLAYLVKAEDRTIYHAGDLNDWRWIGEPDEWNRNMQQQFHEYAEPLRGMAMDAAFIPLDPRQDDLYTCGMDYYLSLISDGGAPNIRMVFPDHFWEKYDTITRWLEDHPESPWRDRMARITGQGQEFYL